MTTKKMRLYKLIGANLRLEELRRESQSIYRFLAELDRGNTRKRVRGICLMCHQKLPRLKRFYCKDSCAHLAHIAKMRAWRRAYRKRTGRWAHPASEYWSLKLRREKGRIYTARYRRRKKQITIAIKSAP